MGRTIDIEKVKDDKLLLEKQVEFDQKTAIATENMRNMIEVQI